MEIKNKKYRVRGTFETAFERNRREARVLSVILDALKQVETEAMVYRLEEGRSLKEPLTHEEILKTFDKIKARIERRRAYWNSASGLNAIDGAEPSPEMAEATDEPKPTFDEFARMIGADVYSDLPNVEIDPNDITPEELFRTWAVAKGLMEIRKEPTPELLELMQKERQGEITVEEIKKILQEAEEGKAKG